MKSMHTLLEGVAAARNHIARVALLLSLLLTVCLFCTGTAAASPAVSLSLTVGPPTTSLLVSGTGFDPYIAVYIYFDTKNLALATTDSSGDFSNIGIRAPVSAVPGTHWVTAVERYRGTAAQASFLVQTDWAQYRFAPSHKGVNPYENVLSPKTVGQLDLNWSYGTGGGVSTPAVAGGLVYIGSYDGHVYALNAGTGTLVWEHQVADYLTSAPVVVNGVTYASDVYGILWTWNDSTGAPLWTYSTLAIGSSPTVANGTVYFGTNDFYNDNGLTALTASTGTFLWTYPTGSNGIENSPAVANGVAYFGCDDYNVYALNASTGALLWQYLTGFFVSPSPTVANGAVYVGSDDDNLYALNATTGTLLWKYTTGGQVHSSPAVANGVVYVGSADNNVYALNATTGALVWKYTTGGSVGDPAVANGVVYFASDDNNLYALGASTGALLWRYTMGNYLSAPVVVNGTVYLGSADNNLYTFSLTNGPLAEQFSPPPRPNPKLLQPDPQLKPSN